MDAKNKIVAIFNKIHLPTWLVILIAAVLILRIPSFFEPYSYGDEMIYLTLGEGIRQGVPLYKDLHDNKPPLLYITAALAGSLFWFKVVLAISGVVAIILFWKLLKTLYPEKIKLRKVSVVVFALLTTLPMLEGNIANAELFMIVPTIAAFIILFGKNVTSKKIFFAGILFSMASLFKIPAAFEAPTIVLYWILLGGVNKKNIAAVFKKTLILFIGFIIPIALTVVWYAARGAFKEYIVAGFLQNVGYLSSWRPETKTVSFFERNIPLFIRFSIVALGILILFIKRKSIDILFSFASIWLLLTLFAITLSERPYPHYFLQAVPPISILLGILFSQKNKYQTLSVIPLTLAFLVPVYFKFWYYPTSTYYLRFVKLATGKVSKNEYFSSFDKETIRNYKISEIVARESKKKDRIFVWGDSSTIYALSRRLPAIKYAAGYHISDFANKDEILAKIKAKPPKFIVILNNSEPFDDLISFTKDVYAYQGLVGGSMVFRLP